MARTKRATTNPRSGILIRRMSLLAVVLLTTLRLIPNGVPCLCRRPIHPRTWKRNSANFAFWGFSEVRLNGVLRSSLALTLYYGALTALAHIHLPIPG